MQLRGPKNEVEKCAKFLQKLIAELVLSTYFFSAYRNNLWLVTTSSQIEHNYITCPLHTLMTAYTFSLLFSHKATVVKILFRFRNIMKSCFDNDFQCLIICFSCYQVENSFSISVPIPKQFHKNIIGKGGANIKKVRTFLILHLVFLSSTCLFCYSKHCHYEICLICVSV